MTNVDFVLSLNQRDEIIKAVKAIERQVNEMADKSQWQALYVVATNTSVDTQNRPLMDT